MQRWPVQSASLRHFAPTGWVHEQSGSDKQLVSQLPSATQSGAQSRSGRAQPVSQTPSEPQGAPSAEAAMKGPMRESMYGSRRVLMPYWSQLSSPVEVTAATRRSPSLAKKSGPP